MAKSLTRRKAKARTTLPISDPESWAERNPLGTCTAFAALLMRCEEPRSLLDFTFGTVIQCTSDAELEVVEHAVHVLSELCREEQARRRVYGVQPRVVQQ